MVSETPACMCESICSSLKINNNTCDKTSTNHGMALHGRICRIWSNICVLALERPVFVQVYGSNGRLHTTPTNDTIHDATLYNIILKLLRQSISAPIGFIREAVDDQVET